jgi:hypothetical protein
MPDEIDHDREIHGRTLRTRAQDPQHELLHRLVARERVVIVHRQHREVAEAALVPDCDRRRKPAVDRQRGPLGNAIEHDLVIALDHDQPLRQPRSAVAAEQRYA